MLNKSILIAAAIVVASAGGAAATTYNITITSSCDTLTLNLSNGLIAGISNAANGCDDSYVVGYQASLKSSVGPGGKVLTAGGDLGYSNEAWNWAFNLKTKKAALTGTSDGQTTIQGTFDFTYTKDAPARVQPGNRLPPATSLLRTNTH